MQSLTLAHNVVHSTSLRVFCIIKDFKCAERVVTMLVYLSVQSKKFQVDISAEEVYAEVLPNHKKDQIAALQENGTKVSVGKHVMEPCRVSHR